MKKEDLIYICTVIGNLSGIPIRLYKGKELIFQHSTVQLPVDPIILCKEQIFAIESHIGYFVTPFFHYYGIVQSEEHQVVIGPTRQVEGTDQELRAIAFQADVPKELVQDFILGMKSIVRMPLSSIIQMQCTINFVLNGERLTLGDVQISDNLQDIMSKYHAKSVLSDPQPQVYTGYIMEQQLMGIIRKGDTAALKEWCDSAPSIRPGLLSADQLRQLKNVFIVSATLASRAAIRGGLDAEDAFALSDAYIQQCELQKDPGHINNLQYHMIRDYTQRVERVRIGARPSQLAIQAANYVQKHLSDTITVADLVDALYMSRSQLSARFKAETGMTLMDFVQKEKIQEAKRLLRYTEKSLTSIATYLGFSSQSHFSRVFKKYTGCTPGEYKAGSTN